MGIDHNPAARPDVVCDLDHFPWPLASGIFDEVRAIHVIEHVADVVRTVEEMVRVLKPGGRLIIETPHYTDFSSFCDPSHRWHLNSFSLRYFTGDDAGFGYYTPVKLTESRIHVRLLALWRLLGFEFLVNRSRRFRKFWEFYLCFVIRGKVITFEFLK